MRSRNKNIPFLVLVLGLLLLISGCVGQAKVVQENSLKDQRPILQAIIQDWEDYNIYYSGRSKAEPKGILIYPKGSERTLEFTEDLWDKVTDKKTLGELISWLEARRDYPRLLSILGPDETLFGYIYTTRYRVRTKLLDPNRVFVYDMYRHEYSGYSGY